MSNIKTQIKKVGIGSLIAAAGAGGTYLLEGLTDISYVFMLNGTEFDATPAVVAILSVAANILRKTLPVMVGAVVSKIKR